MSGSAPPNILDHALRLVLAAALVAGCLWVIAPFATILLWAALLAVMLWPVHDWLRQLRFSGNARSATLIGIVTIALVAAPLVLLLGELGVLAQSLLAIASAGEGFPPAPQWIVNLPMVGPKIAASWDASRGDLGLLLADNKGSIKLLAGKIAGALGIFLEVMFSFGLAALFLAFGEPAAAAAQRFCARVTGDIQRGQRIVTLTTMTIRGVLQGVVGVAVVQAILIGVGLLLFNVPYSGALILVAFVIGLAQLPALLLTIPVIAWGWSHLDGTSAGVFTAFMVLAGFSDQVLKPIMLGRGIDVPMPVILVGVIGGMISGGLLGLFIGPVVLAIGYVLFVEWLNDDRYQSLSS
jgi:predicted PurR-regulated permease PerM